MWKPRVRDVMTEEVVTVRATTSFKAVVQLLATHGIGSVPVVGDDRRVIGVVSEADLLPKQARSRAGRLWRRFSARAAKAGGRVAGDIMSSPVVTIGAGAGVGEAARTMVEHGVKHLPVVDEDGVLTGIVSRADLVNVFVRTDAELRAEIVAEVLIRALCLPVTPADAGVEVADGVVTLTGQVETRSLVPIAESLTRRVAGVVDVVNELTYQRDDNRPGPAGPGDHGVLYGLWH
ncbi:CBS domain-containing protein [Amycolatopsis suaedae]|uniref:CBS domain-containing protein n=1 Tax=Amycolatopsis suaedae TaxID=2510978 RepID=A0A4Q7JF18_9PSEU|nr:CBS domain-containing protein [Amycolatopsis suaedae]RZQ65928.1 CBS domain-containing protein [Amycolatopsis suaedae]